MIKLTNSMNSSDRRSGTKLMMRIFGAFLLSYVALYGQSVVTLNGTRYTLQSHPRTLFDGASGFLNSRIRDPDGSGPLKSPKAVASNPAWVALTNAVGWNIVDYQADSKRYTLRDGTAIMQFAAYWYADNSQTAAHNAALYMLNNIETYLPLLCLESQPECDNGGNGYGITTYGISSWMQSWIMAYELMRSEMTPAQRQTFADKMLNDNSFWGGIDGSPGTSCTNPSASTGQNVSIANPVWNGSDGSLAALSLSGTVLTVTVSGPWTTAGMAVGGNVYLNGAPWNMGLNILAINGPNQFTIANVYGVAAGSYPTTGLKLTYIASYATASGPVFGSTVNLGDWVYDPNNGDNLGIVSAVVDSTHAVFAGDISTTASDTLYYRPKLWNPGQCGALWSIKHGKWVTQVLTYNNGATMYPPNGGDSATSPGQNLIYTALFGLHMVYLSLIDDDVNAAQRSGPQLSAVYNYWYNGQYAFAKQFWTGFHQSGAGYGLAAAPSLPGTAMAIQSSLVNPPNLMGGVWAKNFMVLHYANTFPDAQSSQMQWGQPDTSGAFDNGMTASYLPGIIRLFHWFRNTPEGAYANWWLQNLWASGATPFGNTPGTNLGLTAANLNISNGAAPAWFFMFTDSLYPVTSLAGSPTTFTFNVSDTGVPGQRADALISRTGFLSASDTLLNFHAEAVPIYDHNVFAGQPSNFGSYKIFKGHYLLGEDYNIFFADPNVAGFTLGGTGSNYVEVGGTQNNVLVFPSISSAIPRAKGTNSYAYAMADVSQAYAPAASVQHGYRHLIDFKGGLQQFIVDYVDFATRQGMMKKAYYHYPNKATTTLASNAVTSNNSNGITSQLLTMILAPQPVLIASDTSGGTFRVDVCPSLNGATCDSTNTTAEMMVVHMPIAGSGQTLPPMHLISSIDSHFRGVEIDGSSPKIAVFSRNGTTYTASSFTASHTGTAQILIAGITPSAASGFNYTLNKDGAPVLQRQVVGADGSVYYEGLAGAYQLVAEQIPPTIRIAPLADAIRYQPYQQVLGADGGSVPLTWSIVSAALPAGLSLDSGSGTISGVPTVQGSGTFTVGVTDAVGQTESAAFSLTVDPPLPLLIQTSSVTVTLGIPFSQSLNATGGGGSYTWSVLSGILPAGLSLSQGGIISGSSSLATSAVAVIGVTDQYGETAQQSCAVSVVEIPVTFVSGVTVSGLTAVH